MQCQNWITLLTHICAGLRRRVPVPLQAVWRGEDQSEAAMVTRDLALTNQRPPFSHVTSYWPMRGRHGVTWPRTDQSRCRAPALTATWSSTRPRWCRTTSTRSGGSNNAPNTPQRLQWLQRDSKLVSYKQPQKTVRLFSSSMSTLEETLSNWHHKMSPSSSQGACPAWPCTGCLPSLL